MQIWRGDRDIPRAFERAVVSIGNFDGVHLGHRKVLAEARAEGDRLGAPLVVLTFDPHPFAVLRPEHAPVQLTDIETRARLLVEAGADEVVVLEFSMDIAGWTPQEFVQRVLVEGLGAVSVVVGANFRFGHRAAGDVHLLGELGEASGFEVNAVALEGGPQVWSSTYIRTCLAAGDVLGAAEALGRNFVVVGTVIRGDQRGRELGFPTANVPVNTVASPSDGVYAGWLTRLDDMRRYPAAISVGTNPTFAGERERRVEAYCLDRTDLQLYGVEVEVEFADRIRGMVAFEGVDALIDTMHNDVRTARGILGE